MHKWMDENCNYGDPFDGLNCAGRINEMQRLAWTIHILLDGPKNIGYQELAISPARTDVARFIHLTVGPARSLREGTRLGGRGEMRDFGLSRFATAFMNNSG
jgi:hypothetical protein